ncbi:maleylpyruvate isomerase family mycothiol-dependent enzyme [Actinomycetospora cinnamomea]|uniref:maleylpyruvate isomerase family mycothiol-dependent enzyme n=1 Tax=Actinomycetospora cinnamomea TaxID=663609 RepID=UPI0014029C67|nr:maleylpyruvate isomerase family mycothiol-dependent enzyme [Actinomycetospora cinnamomea]
MLAHTEYGRFAELIERLPPEAWTLPTECAPWDVRLLVAHVVGATEANASPLEMARQLRRGRRGLAIEVDPVSAVQVEHRRRVDPPVLAARFRAAIEDAVRWRARWSRSAGAVPLRVGAPVHETWRLRYLMDAVYTRDVWMHRVDLCRATGQEPALSADHDGRIVADVVADWAARHGRPFVLTLSGPAGGLFARGAGGPELTTDAVEFCRAVSGRQVAPGDEPEGTGARLLATPVPF